jgi:hypothetical protein
MPVVPGARATRLAWSGLRAHTELMPNYSSYLHPPKFALLKSRALIDPALPMMIIDQFGGEASRILGPLAARGRVPSCTPGCRGAQAGCRSLAFVLTTVRGGG